MADISIANLPALVGASATGDLFVSVDVSDTSESPLGTTKRMTVGQLFSGGGVSAPVFNGFVASNGPAPASTQGFEIQANGVKRWRIRGSGNVESGGDAGSDFVIEAFSDAGVAIDQPIFIKRSAGGPILVSRPTTVNAAATINGVAAISATGQPLTVTNSAASTGFNVLIGFQRAAVPVAYFMTDGSDNFVIARGTDGAAAFMVNRTNSSIVIGTDPGGTELLRVGGNVKASGYIQATGDIAGGQFITMGWSATGGIIQTYSSQPLRLNPLGNDVKVEASSLIVGTDPGGTDRVRVGGAVSASGGLIVPGNAQAVLFSNDNTTGNFKYIQMVNAGCNMYFGIENSTGSGLFGGSTAYAAVWGTVVARNVEFFTNNTKRLTIDATGAVTATGLVQATQMKVQRSDGINLVFWNNPLAATNEKIWAIGQLGDKELAIIAYDDATSGLVKAIRLSRSTAAVTSIGFYGVVPVGRQTITTAATLAQVITALQNLGLFSP